MCKAFTSTLGIRHLMPELQMRCSELGFWTCSVLSFAVGLCIFWVKIVDFLYSESDGNFTLSALASCRTRMGKRCGCNNLLHVGPSATVLGYPADSELWQEHTCSTQAGLPKCCFSQHCPRALWPVVLRDFLSGKSFWKVCCFPAGFAPACMSITVSVWGGEKETTTDCVCISFSQPYCPLLFAFNKSVYDVSAVRYLLQVSDQWSFWKWSQLLNVGLCFMFKFVKVMDCCNYHW